MIIYHHNGDRRLFEVKVNGAQKIQLFRFAFIIKEELNFSPLMWKTVRSIFCIPSCHPAMKVNPISHISTSLLLSI